MLDHDLTIRPLGERVGKHSLSWLSVLTLGLGVSVPNLSLAQDAPPPPPNRGTPQTDGGTGSRGNCLHKANYPPFAQLVQTTAPTPTLRAHPTVWVFVPYSRDEAPQGEFSIQSGEDDIYRVPFELPNTPGLVSVTLPSNLPPLEVDQPYRWYFDIDCPSRNVATALTPASVTGLVQRVAPTPQLGQGDSASRSLAVNQMLELAEAYLDAELWFDAVTLVADLRQQHPNNPQVLEAWSNLLGDRPIHLPAQSNPANFPIGSIITSSQPE